MSIKLIFADEIYLTNRSRFAIFVDIIVPEPFYILVSSKDKQLLNARLSICYEEESINLHKNVTYISNESSENVSEEEYIDNEPEIIQYFNFLTLKLEDKDRFKLVIEFKPQYEEKCCFVNIGDMKIDFKTHSRHVN